jgi:hypothetical protein
MELEIMKHFIIDRLNDEVNDPLYKSPQIDSILFKCILPIVNSEITSRGTYFTLEFTDFDNAKKHINVHESVGEIYTEEVRQRRKKDLAIRNIISLMNYNSISIEDLQNYSN